MAEGWEKIKKESGSVFGVTLIFGRGFVFVGQSGKG